MTEKASRLEENSVVTLSVNGIRVNFLLNVVIFIVMLFILQIWIWLILMVNLVMLISISNLAETFATSILTFKGLFRDVSSHMIV